MTMRNRRDRRRGGALGEPALAPSEAKENGLSAPGCGLGHGRWAALVAAAVSLLSACGGESENARPDSARDSATTIGGPPPDGNVAPNGAAGSIVPPPGGARQRATVIQVGAFADSAIATRLVDSLRALGAPAYRAEPDPLPPGAVAKPVWRVRVVVPGASGATRADSALLVGATALALRPGSPTDTLNRPRPYVARDSVPAELGAPVRLHHVNRGGTHGMTSRVRWVLSPDRVAILAVEDPASVEAEPVGNGHVYASESGPVPVLEGKSWDVNPSPDWKWLAWATPWIVSARERDSLSTAQWRELARDAGLSVAEVRRGSFPASGMAIAAGLARPAIVRLDGAEPRPRADGKPNWLPMTGGWRMRWTGDGRLLVGLAPRSVQDMTDSDRWVVVDPVSGRAGDTLGGNANAARVEWTQGPTIDIGVPLDLRANGRIAVAGGTVESAGGWISVRDASGRRRAVGPGTALAATRTGRLILALVPDPAPKSFENPVAVLVYRLP